MNFCKKHIHNNKRDKQTNFQQIRTQTPLVFKKNSGGWDKPPEQYVLHLIVIINFN